MHPKRFQLIMLEVIRPKLAYLSVANLFLNIKESEKGKIEIDTGVLVPDYEEAIYYYLEDHPANRQNPAYQQAPAYNRVKTAYTYLWKSFQYEVNETATKSELLELLSFFEGFRRDVECYQLIIKWISVLDIEEK